MIRLLKQMKLREVILAAVCAVLVLGQIYFDLKLPDYMSNLTVILQTPGSTTSDVWRVGGEMLLCALGSMALSVICGYLAAKVAAGFSYTLRERIFGTVSSFDQQEMLDFSVPSLITRTTNDVTQIQMLIAMGLQLLVKSPIMAVWAVIKIIGKSWELSLVTAAFIAVLLIIMAVIMVVLIPRFKRVQRQIDVINRITRENLTGIKVVHAFNAEQYQCDKFKTANDNLTKTQLFNQRTMAVLMPVMTLAMNGLALAIYWIGAALINNIPSANMADRLTLFSDVVVFSTYATYVIMSLMMLVMIFMMLPAAQVSADRINEVLNTKSKIKEGSMTDGPETGTVEFKNVSFRYPSSEHDVLHNISFKVNKGETIAFIGATGSAKTTLVSLAARLYDTTDGEVLIDGINIKDYTFDALYDKIGYITQRAVLFSGTVRDNINFGESSAPVSDDNTWRALDIAQATDFVEKMPGGIDAEIAQGGTNVSGGQKQRLSIARALARQPEILIFDDSFSALDYKTDAKLRAELNRQLKGTTLMIVAQRIGTIRHADKIVVLDNGKAVGIGTHDELIQNCDVYKEIAMSQLSPEELGA
ncbi:MAG TPA: ABC transporter ATP-binding protein/permease [Firmicutes bacterium]|nr:ABC transporter ATP-binding protein/permease [Bacillota bacterium]